MVVIPAIKRGDFWDGMVVTIPLDLTGYSIKADFKTSQSNRASFTFSTDDDTIEPTGTNGRIVFVGRKMNYQAQRYISDLELTPPNGETKTILDFIWELKQDITQ